MLKPNECIDCPLEKIGYSFSEPDGMGGLGVIGIGEGLGHDEAVEGKPFRPRAAAGSQLTDAMALAGGLDLISPPLLPPFQITSRSQFRLWNLIACQPPGNELAGAWYEDKAIAHCRTAHFNRVVGGFHPPSGRERVLLAFGNIPMRVLTGMSGVGKERQSISHLRGYVMRSEFGWVVPTWHPSYIKRGAPELIPHLVEDIKKAVRVANHLYTGFKGGMGYRERRYQETPSLDQAWSFYYQAKDNPRIAICYDIETPTSKDLEEDERYRDMSIISFQFSLAEETGIFMAHEDGFKEVIRKILELPNLKFGHNVWLFDNPAIWENGYVINGEIWDTMWMFHHMYPDLPKNLQAAVSLFDFPFPWKHLSGSRFYGCADVDAPWLLMKKLPGIMKRYGIWGDFENKYKGYKGLIHNFRPILKAAEDRGMPVDIKAKRELDGTEVGKEGYFVKELQRLDGELQELVPDELKDLEPKRKVKEMGSGY